VNVLVGAFGSANTVGGLGILEREAPFEIELEMGGAGTEGVE